MGKPEIGVYLKQATPLIDAIKLLSIEDSRLIDPEIAKPRRDRVTVYLANHGSFIAPFPSGILTAEYLLEQGGYEDFVMVSLFHRVAELIPGLYPLLVHYFGHSTRKLQSVPGLIELMKARAFQIIGTTPEARSALLTWPEPIGPFTKVGLIVAALEADADIVLAAQRGIEVFGVPVELPRGLSIPFRGRPRGLLLPLWYPGRRARVTVAYRRYEPILSVEERIRLDGAARREQLDREIERIRDQMIDLYESIPEGW